MVSHPAFDIIDTNDPNALKKLSPAEKYDLAMGDENFSLTKSAWARGQYALDTFGVVDCRVD